ncbi:MAG: carbohydrate binding family 9 domain-containing protein [Tannerellaceae bacterium]|jgi:hypothetical protein|nr:carbohydrate binding family 9 domain-containing protein [Tannerellaceae bacterium]
MNYTFRRPLIRVAGGRLGLSFALYLFFFGNLWAQDEVIDFEDAYKRTYVISRALSAPVMDGSLDEPFWNEGGKWTDFFVQVTPFERVKTASYTRAKLFYDDSYIYVGVYCRDEHPDKIIRFIGNRDENNTGDLISIAFDTYHNYRAAPEFNINVGGNKTDLVVTDKLEVNRSWNAVWEGRTAVNTADSAWTAELRIPLSQLRYNSRDTTGVWGLHIRRIIRRNNEIQNWSMIPLKNNGHIFSFGVMEGLHGLPPARGVEVLPYTMGKYRGAPAETSNPYAKKSALNFNAGVDIKFGLSDFTLDMTVNPDFGQIELDPSVMNLTAYETFFDEKRPFFLEGKHILDFASGSDNMFYTRRIGAAPSFKPPVDNIQSFAEEKGNVPIIGALKLTGANSHGLSLGLIQSVTAGSEALVSSDGAESSYTVEPLTSYTVARLQQNIKGNLLVGGMVTYAARKLDADYLKDFMPREAVTAGIDYTQYFMNRLYFVDAKAMYSALSGSNASITRLEESAVHYYQRESGRSYLGVDKDATSLKGSGGYIRGGRRGNSPLAFAGNLSWATPGFDLNTLGYLKQADFVTASGEVEFRRTTVWGPFRSNNIMVTGLNQWDFGGQPTLNSLTAAWKAMLLNRIEWNVAALYAWNSLDTRKLRGGGDLRYDPYFRVTASFNTDKAKALIFTLNAIGEENTNGVDRLLTLRPALSLRAGDHIQLSGELTYTGNTDNTQYVGTSSINNIPYFLMGRMEQDTYSATLKVQLNITPDISVQFYGSPFTSSARYSSFKKALDPSAVLRTDRFKEYTADDITVNDGRYSVPDGDGRALTFSNPDFNFNEFRSNIVARWEYLPGSTLYFVWEHRMSGRTSGYKEGWGENLDRMFSLPAVNTLMLKVNYWFTL